jgi:hypothetical protein
MVAISVPAASCKVAKVCLKEWNVNGLFIPALATHFFNVRKLALIPPKPKTLSSPMENELGRRFA